MSWIEVHIIYHSQIPHPDASSMPTPFNLFLFWQGSFSAQLLRHVWLFAIPWTVACQAPQSMDFSKQEYWSGYPLPTTGNLPDPGIETASPPLAGGFFTTAPPGKPQDIPTIYKIHSISSVWITNFCLVPYEIAPIHFIFDLQKWEDPEKQHIIWLDSKKATVFA